MSFIFAYWCVFCMSAYYAIARRESSIKPQIYAFIFIFCVSLRVFLDFCVFVAYYLRAMLNERLQNWLILTGTSRIQLAELLHISPRTVEGWLGKKPRPIPARLHNTLERLIAPPAEPGCIPLQLRLTEEQWERFTAHIPDGLNKKEVLIKQLMAMLNALELPKS